MAAPDHKANTRLGAHDHTRSQPNEKPTCVAERSSRFFQAPVASRDEVESRQNVSHAILLVCTRSDDDQDPTGVVWHAPVGSFRAPVASRNKDETHDASKHKPPCLHQARRRTRDELDTRCRGIHPQHLPSTSN